MPVIDDDLERLVPLLTPESRQTWKRVLEHPDAPIWNARVGDQVIADDLGTVDALRQRLATAGSTGTAAAPPDDVHALVEHALRTVPLHRNRAPTDLDMTSDWRRVPFTTRDDLATRPELLVPDDADLSRLIVHSTSGTSGHAVVVPMTPGTLALSHALLERVLAAHGVPFAPRPEELCVTHLCARRETYVFATVFSVWNGAPFAKLNLDEAAWPGGRDAARGFASAWPTAVASGDPGAFAEALAWELPVTPRAFVSTAYALEPALAERLTDTYGARVIDWYSLTETGPIAASAPDGQGLVVVAPDLFVEAIGSDAEPVADGERGELVVSGGRNPCLPLVRYRTGDTGRIVRSVTGDGSIETRLLDLEGRHPVVFRDAADHPIASVDVTRTLRAAAQFAQHAIHQHADGSLEVTLREIPGVSPDTAACEQALHHLLKVAVRVEIDHTLGREHKPTAYRCDVAGHATSEPEGAP